MQPDADAQPDTVFSTLTPVGRGAIAVIACRGPRAVSAIDQLFTPASGRPLTLYSPGTFVYGHWANSEDLIVYLIRLYIVIL